MRAENIDILDARIGTKAPFTYESTLRLGDGLLDPGLFAAIAVDCSEHVRPPVSIRYIEPVSSKVALMWLVDAGGRRVASIRLDADAQPSAGIPAYAMKDDSGIVRGLVSYLPGLAKAVLAAVGDRTDRVYLGAGAFELLPCCLRPAVGGYVRALSVGGRTVVSDVTLAGCACVHVDKSEGTHSFSVIKVPAVDRDGTYRWLKVDNVRRLNGVDVTGMSGRVWIGGCHLVLRHGVASNLRVAAGDNGVSLKGVADG